MSLVLPLAAAGAGTGTVSVVGGKAASLGELARAGVAVPPGFVVAVPAYTMAMAALDPDGTLRAALSALPADDLAGIAEAAARFRALVAGAELPAAVAEAVTAAYAALGGGPGSDPGDDAGDDPAGGPAGAAASVAVRSSATVEDSPDASFAGLQDSYLGVSGSAAVLDGVRRCWASLYNDESLTYRRRLGMSESDVSMAVVVQRMVAPRAAGVMFTRSPLTGDRSVVAIEGTWGLGSALVSGDVTPDSWVISKITGEVTTRRVSPKVKIHSYMPNGSVVTGDVPPHLRDAPCLADGEIRALAAIGRRVEAHYGAPQDIEWAVLDGEGDGEGDGHGTGTGTRIVLLQSRPETVWAAREAPPAGAPRPRAADHVLALFGKPL